MTRLVFRDFRGGRGGKGGGPIPMGGRRGGRCRSRRMQGGNVFQNVGGRQRKSSVKTGSEVGQNSKVRVKKEEEIFGQGERKFFFLRDARSQGGEGAGRPEEGPYISRERDWKNRRREKEKQTLVGFTKQPESARGEEKTNSSTSEKDFLGGMRKRERFQLKRGLYRGRVGRRTERGRGTSRGGEGSQERRVLSRAPQGEGRGKPVGGELKGAN